MKSNITSAFVRVLPVSVLAALVVGLSGCSHRVYNVKVDAIQNPEVATGYSYRLVDKDAARHGTESHHEQTLAVVRTALAARGMYEAPDPAQAEVEVAVDYGIGPRRLKIQNYETGMEPTVARAPLAIIPLRQPNGQISYAAIPAEKLDVDGTYRGISVLRGAHVFEKYLLISARETPAAAGLGRKPAEAWQVQARVEDTQDTLTDCLPVLAGAAAEYLGTSTGRQERIRLRDDAPVVALAKAGH